MSFNVNPYNLHFIKTRLAALNILTTCTSTRFCKASRQLSKKDLTMNKKHFSVHSDKDFKNFLEGFNLSVVMLSVLAVHMDETG